MDYSELCYKSGTEMSAKGHYNGDSNTDDVIQFHTDL